MLNCAKIVMLALVVSTLSARAEVPACNDADIMNTLQNETFDKEKTAALAFVANQPHGRRTAEFLDDLNRWESTYENIRQIQYDAENDARYCAAQVSTNIKSVIPIDLAFVLYGIPDPSCAHGIEYTLRPLLDKPGTTNIEWICR